MIVTTGYQACNAVDPGFSPWVEKIPWRRESLPIPVFWPGEFHGLYNPWGLKELDTTEQLSLSLGKFASLLPSQCIRLVGFIFLTGV